VNDDASQIAMKTEDSRNCFRIEKAEKIIPRSSIPPAGDAHVELLSATASQTVQTKEKDESDPPPTLLWEFDQQLSTAKDKLAPVKSSNTASTCGGRADRPASPQEDRCRPPAFMGPHPKKENFEKPACPGRLGPLAFLLPPK